MREIYKYRENYNFMIKHIYIYIYIYGNLKIKLVNHIYTILWQLLTILQNEMGVNVCKNVIM